MNKNNLIFRDPRTGHKYLYLETISSIRANQYEEISSYYATYLLSLKTGKIERHTHSVYEGGFCGELEFCMESTSNWGKGCY